MSRVQARLASSENGTITAWAPNVDPTNALLVVDNSGSEAIYKGLALAANETGNFLYATDFHNGKIDVFDKDFTPATPPGSFNDPLLPAGFVPFGIRNINGNLYVTYAKQNASKHDDFDFPGFGFVDKFSPKGKLLQRLKHGPWLNAPWGVALAPANFGFFSNHLFIGNAGSGQIAVYDADTGRFDGLLRDSNGHAIQNDRLWALRFGNDHAAGPSNWLFFTAGISDEAHGLFGFFTPAQ